MEESRTPMEESRTQMDFLEDFIQNERALTPSPSLTARIMEGLPALPARLSPLVHPTTSAPFRPWLLAVGAAAAILLGIFIGWRLSTPSSLEIYDESMESLALYTNSLESYE